MREKLFMLIFILILGTLLTGILVGVDYYMEPMIAKNKELKIKTSTLEAFDITHTRDAVEKIFSENIKTITIDDKLFYISRNNEIAFEISGSGLWGPIEGVMAILPDLRTIKGINIVQQEETPGLGGRIAEKDYLAKFKGKILSPGIKIMPVGKAVNENEVDGITGATMTSEAFEELVNSQSRKYLSLIKESRG